MAGCPTDWTYVENCDTQYNDCTSNECNTNSKQRQNYNHYYHRCKTTQNGVTYKQCFYASSSKDGCC